MVISRLISGYIFNSTLYWSYKIHLMSKIVKSWNSLNRSSHKMSSIH